MELQTVQPTYVRTLYAAPWTCVLYYPRTCTSCAILHVDEEARRYVLYARQGEPRCVMPPPMDLSLYVHTRHLYRRRCPEAQWKMFYGTDFEGAKVKWTVHFFSPNESGLHDRRCRRFMNWGNSGIVDFSLDEETVSKRVESPAAGSPPLSKAKQAEPPPPVSLHEETPLDSTVGSTNVNVGTTTTTAETRRMETRKRLRVDYPLPLSVVSEKWRNTAAARLPGHDARQVRVQQRSLVGVVV
jgi:hypothetical protein